MAETDATFVEIVAKLVDTHRTAELLATLYNEATIEHVPHTFMLVGKSLVTTVPASF